MRDEQQLSALSGLDNNAESVSPADDRMATGTIQPKCPKGLPARVGEIWRMLLQDMLAAKVPTAQLDAQAILQAARCLWACEISEKMIEDKSLDGKTALAALTLNQRAIDQSGKWLDRLGATPVARARMGVKAPVEKPEGALAKLLRKKAGG